MNTEERVPYNGLRCCVTGNGDGLGYGTVIAGRKVTDRAGGTSVLYAFITFDSPLHPEDKTRWVNDGLWHIDFDWPVEPDYECLI